MPKKRKNIYTELRDMDMSPHDSSINQNIYTALGLKDKKKRKKVVKKREMKDEYGTYK